MINSNASTYDISESSQDQRVGRSYEENKSNRSPWKFISYGSRSKQLPSQIHVRVTDNTVQSSETVDTTPSPNSLQPKPNLNSNDTFRRVSMVVHRHICIGEEHHKTGHLKAKETKANQYMDLDEESRKRLFLEADYVKPRWRYHFVRLPQLRFQSTYCIQKVDYVSEFPTQYEIYTFLKTLFCKAQLSGECSIVCLIYVERLMEIAGIPLLASNWKPIMLCGLLLASKVWQDLSSWNIEFACVYPQYSLQSINKMERLFIRYLNWDLYISGSVYAKYYFAIRSLERGSNFRKKYNFAIDVQSPPNSKTIEQRSAEMRNSFHSRGSKHVEELYSSLSNAN